MKHDLQRLVTDLASKYDVPSILERAEEVATSPTAKIGLIGPFSAGKTSLLNAMVGSKLPVALDPTTKSVCLVEFRKGIDKPLYWLDDGDERKQVGFMEFDDLIAGQNAEKQIVGVAQFPETGDFHEDVVFVDTPGVDSLSREEADVTYNYLAFLDAGIVCLPIVDGTVQQSVVDFLADPRMAMIAKRLIFVLTKCDLKPAEAVEAVRGEVVRQLETLTEKGVLALGGNVNERVFTFSTKQDSEALVAFLREHLLHEVPRLARERQALRFKAVARDLADILEEQQSQLRYDSSQLDAEKRRLQQELDSLEEDARKRRATFAALEGKLSDEVYAVMMGYEGAITTAPDEETRKASIADMVKAIQQTATDFAQRHVKDFRPGDGLCGNLDVRLNDMLATVESFRTIAEKVSDAIIATAGGPVGKAAVAGKYVSKAIIGKAAKAVKKAVKSSKRSFLKGFLENLDFNPIGPFSNIVARKVKNGKFEALARQTSGQIAGTLMEMLDEPYQEAVIRPVTEKLQEAERGIDALRSQDAQALAEYRETRKTLKADCDALRAAANK